MPYEVVQLWISGDASNLPRGLVAATRGFLFRKDGDTPTSVRPMSTHPSLEGRCNVLSSLVKAGSVPLLPGRPIS